MEGLHLRIKKKLHTYIYLHVVGFALPLFRMIFCVCSLQDMHQEFRVK